MRMKPSDGRRRASRLLGAITVAALAATVAQAQGAAADGQGERIERWKAVATFGGASLEMLVVFTPAGEALWTATIDIPLQGVNEAPLADVAYTEDEIAFTYQPAGAPFAAAFSLARQGDTATGSLEQAGQAIPVQMERLAPGADAAIGPRRPQTPKPPFPYTSMEVEVEGADGAQLAGSLVIPPGEGPFSAALFLSGSGPQDRDETLAAHKPFLVLADALARAGVASLRLDDRGVGGSAGSLLGATVQTLAQDAQRAVEFLRSRPEIDASRVGVIGHSEGGVIGPMTAAARPESVAFLVLIAGPGVPGDQLMPMQLKEILEAAGAPEQFIDEQVSAQRAFLETVKTGADDAALRAALRQLLITQTTGAEPQSQQARDALDQQVEAQLAQWGSPWFRSYLRVDPRKHLSRVACPTLAVVGSLDRQVPADANLAAIEEALAQAGNERFETHELAGLNHLLQPATRGTPDEYAQIETTIDAEALAQIVAWITEITAVAGG